MFDPAFQSLRTTYMKTVPNKELDVVASLYSYHFLNEHNKLPTFIADKFWGDDDVSSIELCHWA